MPSRRHPWNGPAPTRRGIRPFSESEALQVSGTFRICLVATDDLMGGWTNRYAVELGHLLGERDLLKRGWLTVPLWTSETYTTAKVAASVLACIHRIAYAQRHGYPEEPRRCPCAGDGGDGRHSGTRRNWGPPWMRKRRPIPGRCCGPCPALSDAPTLIAALFGDEAARQLGHSPLGLSPRAGLALAFTDAGQRPLIS